MKRLLKIVGFALVLQIFIAFPVIADDTAWSQGKDFNLKLQKVDPGSERQRTSVQSQTPQPYEYKVERACSGVPVDLRSVVSACVRADECARQGQLATTRYTVLPNGQEVHEAGVASPVLSPTDRVVNAENFCDDADPANIDELARVEFYRHRPEVPAPMTQTDGVTVANIPTIFYSTIAQQTDIPVTLAGRSVVLRVNPVSYYWDFGDKQYLTTTKPGAPIDLSQMKDKDAEDVERAAEVTHRYQRGCMAYYRLTVKFHGQYSIDNSTFTPIVGTVTNTSPPKQVQVKVARAQLIDPNDPPPTKTPHNNYEPPPPPCDKTPAQ
jgi:hypothetical protein